MYIYIYIYVYIYICVCVNPSVSLFVCWGDTSLTTLHVTESWG